MNTEIDQLNNIIKLSFEDTYFVEAEGELDEEARKLYLSYLKLFKQLRFQTKHSLDTSTLTFRQKQRVSAVSNLHGAFVRLLGSLVLRRAEVALELPELLLEPDTTPIMVLLQKATGAAESVLEMLEDEYPDDIELDKEVAEARHEVMISTHEPRYDRLSKAFRLRGHVRAPILAIIADLVHPFFDYQRLPTRRRFAVIRHFLHSLETRQQVRLSTEAHATIHARQIVSALVDANHNDPFVIQTLQELLKHHLARFDRQRGVRYLKGALAHLKSLSPPRRNGSSPEHPNLWEQLNRMLKGELEGLAVGLDSPQSPELPEGRKALQLGVNVDSFALLASAALDAKVITGTSQAELARRITTQFVNQNGEPIAEKSLIKRLSSVSEKSLEEAEASIERIGQRLARKRLLLDQATSQ